MKKKFQKLIALCIIASMLVVTASGCSKSGGSNGGASEDNSFTYWLAQGEDSSYYASYDKNPAVEYMLTRNYKNSDGKDTKINIEFQIPPAGSAEQNLNTMISTGDYTDVMDMSLYRGSVLDLYDEGIVQDLTPYVEKYMPNYVAFLDAHPDLKLTATNLIDGERKYVKLYTYIKDMQNLDQWCGYQYRRDWIVKYGKNPEDGSAFSGEWTIKNADGTVNVDSWVDNVVFPSGGPDPIYISDWEWMLEIFKTALADQGITDGYCMSIPFSGFNGTGDLVSAFGGSSSTWYKDKDGKIQYGLNSDNFRVYLQAVNTWYKNGWIDTAFAEHANDMFYKIDDAKVRQGKVGLWMGILSQLIGKLDIGEGYSKGAVVFAARQPINDKYGSAAQQNVTPYCFYQMALEGSPLVITDKATEKDIATLCSFLDYQFSPEGMLLKRMGLSKEQYELTKNEMYTKEGLTEGAYTDTVNADGVHEVEFVQALKDDTGLEHAARANRLFGVDSVPDGYLKVNKSQTETYKHNIAEWTIYKNDGYLQQSFLGQLNAEDLATYTKIQTNINEFSNQNVPSFVNGEKDPFNDTDWESFKKALGKYKPESNTELLQKLLESMQ